MKIKFIGVPGERHDSIHMYGLDYPLGEYVETTDALAIKKMSGHPHFEAKKSAPADVQDVEVKTEQEQEHGDTNGPGDTSPAKVGKPRGRRSSKRA